MPVMSDLADGRVARWPHFLPDGRQFVALIIGGDDSGVFLGSLDSQALTKLKPTGLNDLTALGFTEPDYLLFVAGPHFDGTTPGCRQQVVSGRCRADCRGGGDESALSGVLGFTAWGAGCTGPGAG